MVNGVPIPSNRAVTSQPPDKMSKFVARQALLALQIVAAASHSNDTFSGPDPNA